MSHHVTFATGVVRACLAAGPTFLAAAALFTTLAIPAPVPVGPVALAAPFLAVPAIAVGGLVALLPSLLGTTVMAYLSRHNTGLRLPVAWALVGGLVAGGAAFGSEAEPTMTAAFAATGAICALLCRSGTRWQD